MLINSYFNIIIKNIKMQLDILSSSNMPVLNFSIINILKL